MGRLLLLVALLAAPAAAVTAFSRARALELDAADDAKERPVMKVVRLLKDMQAELSTDLEDDKAVHETLDCWCETNEKEKTKAIELGAAKEEQLKAFLGEAVAKMKEMKEKREATQDEVDADVKALQEARALRMKESKEFHAEEVNLMEASKACQQALVSLGKHSSAMPDFAQIRTAAQYLQRGRVLTLGRISPGRMAALKNFLSEAQGATSFLAVPGFQSYAPQSGQIIGILEQMKEDFDKDLADARAKEEKAVEDFKLLKAAKEEEIAAGKKLVVNLDQNIADLKEKHAVAFKELEDTQKQLELDQTFLANLQKKCSTSESEFEQRVKDRMAEIIAVEDTIKILNNDSAFDNFDKTVNSASFLQVSSRSREQELRQRVATVLQRAAGQLGAGALSLLALHAKLNAFTEVNKEIDKMVMEFKQQQADEIKHRDWCIAELNKNNRSTEASYDRKDSLTTKIAELEKMEEDLTKEIEATKATVAETQVQMKKAGENREAENADFQQTIVDQRVTQQILDKALTRMKQVYALMQKPGAPHVQTSATDTDPGNGPARFTEYEENKGGSKVVSLLEEVMADSKKTEDEAIVAEQDSQAAYELFMKESNEAIIQMGDKITSMSEALAKTKEELIMTKDDLQSTVEKLEELHNTNGSLHKACDYVMDNFDARQAARAAEIDALNEAKAILSGAQ